MARPVNILIVFLCSVLACSDAPVPAFRVLFVGNSLTYYNDLPNLVEKQANKLGLKLKSEMVALPNYGLEDHWVEGAVQKLIATERFDLVVVQQGPSSQAEGREMLLNYGEKFNALCKEHKARLAFFMVWPSRAYYHTFPGVIKNYSDAAIETNALIFPVGKIWKAHFDATNDFSFYGPDGFHPSQSGSEKAAEVIANEILKIEQ